MFKILHKQTKYPDWKEISNLLKEVNVDKTPLLCYRRWYFIKKENKDIVFKFKKRKSEHWSKAQENQLLKLLKVQKEEYPDWKKISRLLKKINIDNSWLQCYLRWYYNKTTDKYNICKFDLRKRKKKQSFTKEEQKKLLKLCFAYDPDWKKISNFFKDKNIDYIYRKFFTIVKESFIKVCKLSNIKNGKFLLRKCRPGTFTNLFKQEIKIDFTEFKKLKFGKKDKDCPDFIFLSFYEFFNKIYYNDYEEI